MTKHSYTIYILSFIAAILLAGSLAFSRGLAGPDVRKGSHNFVATEMLFPHP